MGNSEIDARKAELRKRLKQLRRDLAQEERTKADSQITQQVCSLPEYENASTMLTYLSVGEEIDTRKLIMHAWANGKRVAIPRVVPHTRNMDFYLIDSFDDVEISSFGIEEPLDDPTKLLSNFDADMMAIVPALTFDPQGFRLGYGGGFYDTLLEKFECPSIGLCREAQVTEDLASEGVLDAHDRSVGVVVTESRTIRI